MPLLIPDREFSLGLLVILREALQFLDILALVHRQQELDVRLGILMARVDERIVGEVRELRERGLHFGGGPLEELAAAPDEERVAREDGALRRRRRSVDHVVADAVLGVARGVDGRDGDVAPEVECLAVGWRGGHERAVLAAEDGHGVGQRREEVGVAACVVAVVVRVEDGGQVDGRAEAFAERGEDFWGVGRVDEHAVGCGCVGHEVGVVVAGADPCGGVSWVQELIWGGDGHMGMDSIFMVRACWRGIRAVDVRRGRRRRELIIDGWGGGYGKLGVGLRRDLCSSQ